MKEIPVILHPFVFASLPVVLLLTFAKTELLPEELIPALIGLEFTNLCALLVVAGLTRNIFKGAIASSFFVISLFTYRIWQILLDLTWPIIETQPWISLTSFFFIDLLLLVFFLKGKWRFAGRDIAIDFQHLNRILNVVSSLLLLMNFIPLMFYEIEQHGKFLDEKAIVQRPFENVRLDMNAERPDVYYIILDGFAAPSTIKEWHFPDAGFESFLEKNGFYIAKRSLSNFDRTEFSICSSLNMDYINPIHARHKDGDTGLIFMRLLQDSSVLKLFKQLNYRFVTVSSGSFGTDQIWNADAVIRANYVNHFFRAVAYCTPWWSLEYYFPVLRDCYCDTRLTASSKMAQILSEKGPKFVFIHTDLPHAPYLFDDQGRRLKLPPGLIPDWEPPSSYYAQWKFCIAQTESWIEKIKAATHGKAIIIVQSDHGSGLRTKKVPDWYNERMRIMNAYYFPERGMRLYPEITPVNSFRMFFNDYFNASLPILKDQSYCAPVWEKQFEWKEVTKQITFPGELK